MLHGLAYVKDFWYGLLHGDLIALQKVDQATVQAVELMAPRYSKGDAQSIQGKLLSGQIFSGFTLDERQAIWDALRSFDGLIPTLFSFSEDVKYLLHCADCMKRLIDETLETPDTIYTAMEANFSQADPSTGRCVLQESESSFSSRPGTEDDRFVVGYRQLWLYAMRHYTQLPAEPKRTKKELLAKAGSATADAVILHEFAALADKLGFKSTKIDDLMERSPDREIARKALLQARRPDRYIYDEAILEACVEEVTKLFSNAQPLPPELGTPSLVSENATASGNRCGFPDEECHKEGCRDLFIANIHRGGEGQAEGITPFFVRRSVYFAFFGRTASVDWNDITDDAHDADDNTRLAQAERERLAQVERERLAQAERERLAQAERERLAQAEQERLARETRDEQRSGSICINFNVRELGTWRTAHSLLVDPADTSEIERMAKKYLRKQYILFDYDLYPLTPLNCFQAAIMNGRNAIYLIAGRNIDIRKDGLPPLPELQPEAEAEPEGKRSRR